MHSKARDPQVEAIANVLTGAMAIIRDDKPFNPDDSVFGQKIRTEKYPGYPGGVYLFTNKSLPQSRIIFSTAADPSDLSEDRMKVPVVPVAFEILFTGPLVEVNRYLLEERLDLANYWVDREGQKQQGNDMGPGFPPQERIHRYRYRANDHIGTRASVNVDLDYVDTDSDNPAEPPKLLHVIIERAYPLVTPEDRKRLHEEKEQRIRELYGKPEATK
ncbi:hypothetical protein [Paraburkholderia pallida]|uniref:Uncharacterized protein n=1 Tax=Paraburkholderia pallida TaxID=2547399 RepID=A0A4P7D8K7_9BURK|nr:hypothetical protein [Paraburkholderia pallida]QBR03164.1 hypothetical protein E1956_39040 [Paraburkholderia pallida]